MGKHRSSKTQDENMAIQIDDDLSPRFHEVNGEESYREPLPNHEEALWELKFRIEDAILDNSLLGKPNNGASQVKEIKLWGVPLMPSKHHEGTDIVLLKFLRSKHYKVDEAFESLRKTLVWREEFKVDEILEESLGLDFEKVGYLDTMYKDGRPLFYNVYGELKDNQMQYHEMLGSKDGFEKYLRCRVQYMEKCIEKLDFKHCGANSMIQVIDWKDFQGLSKKELRSVYRKCLSLIEDHYPEIIHRNIIINVPLWYHVSHSLPSRLKTHHADTKTVFARPEKVTETLLKFVSPENLPVEYGGLKRINDNEFSSENKALKLHLKPHASTKIEIPALEVGVTIVWDVTVVGWEVTYKEEFVPEDEGSYKVSLHDKEKKGSSKISLHDKEKKGSSKVSLHDKEKKVAECVRNSYYINEAGKIVISIHNHMNKSKKILYRYKTKPTVPIYLLHKRE